MTDGRGFSIEFDGHSGFITVSPNEGDVFLGVKRMIPGKSIIAFRVGSSGKESALSLEFKSTTGTEEIRLGVMEDADTLHNWAMRINHLYSPEHRWKLNERFLGQLLTTTPLHEREITALLSISVQTYVNLIDCPDDRISKLTNCDLDAILQIKKTLTSCANRF